METSVRRSRKAEAITAPIDQEFVEQAVKILTQHGATVEQLDAFVYEAVTASGRKRVKLSCNHRISFPEGTMRYDGFMLATSFDFRIVFPDGFVLHGIEQLRMLRGDTTIIYLKK